LALVTLDFHNTLFQCDEWFRLEIETLPARFLSWQAARTGMCVDPTLVSDATARYRAIRRGVMSTGRECDAVTSVKMVLNDLNFHAEDGEVDAGVEEIMREALESAAPLPGAIALTRHLEQENVSLAVVSSAAYHPFLEWCLDRYDIRIAFAAVVTSASCGIYKSDPAIYQHTLDLIGVNPREAVHIGDSHLYDVTSAASIGVRTILLQNGSPTSNPDPPPDATITHLGDAIPHLVRLLTRDEPS
jgi:FMN phosphatase YigB (HAD superfamily)